MTAPSGPRSGKHGVVGGLWSVRNWNLNLLHTFAEYVHSGTCLGRERVRGIDDWNYTCEGFGGYTGFFPGNKYSTALFAGPSDGVCGGTGMVWEGEAWCESLTFNFAWQPTAIVTWTATFQGHGCITTDEACWSDTTNLCRSRMCDLGLYTCDPCTFDNNPVMTKWDNVQSVSLTFTNTLLSYVNSNTYCCTERQAGQLDWTMDVVDQEDYPIIYDQDPRGFHLYINSSEFWQLYWGALGNISNISVDIENGTIKTKTNQILMTGRICCLNGTATSECDVDELYVGSITDPCLNVVWPYTNCCGCGAGTGTYVQ